MKKFLSLALLSVLLSYTPVLSQPSVTTGGRDGTGAYHPDISDVIGNKGTYDAFPNRAQGRTILMFSDSIAVGFKDSSDAKFTGDMKIYAVGIRIIPAAGIAVPVTRFAFSIRAHTTTGLSGAQDSLSMFQYVHKNNNWQNSATDSMRTVLDTAPTSTVWSDVEDVFEVICNEHQTSKWGMPCNLWVPVTGREGQPFMAPYTSVAIRNLMSGQVGGAATFVVYLYGVPL